MLRFPHTRASHLFGLSALVILVALSAPASAQSFPEIPTRLGVTSSARTLRVREQTQLRVALHNEQGAEVAAYRDTRLTLFATKLKDADSARQDAGGEDVKGDHLSLSADRTTVRASFVLPKGHTGLTLFFSSAQPGTIHIFAESEKLATGSTLVAVVGGRGVKKHAAAAGRSAAAVLFLNAAFQEPAATTQLRLNLEPGEMKPVPGGWERKLWVELKEGDIPVVADEEIEVRLKVGDGATLEPRSVKIPLGEAGALDPVVLRTTSGGDFKVEAYAVRRGTLAVTSAQTTVKFLAAKRATQLIVDVVPLEALANGLDPIKVRVRAADDKRNTIYGADEGLEVRDVKFKLEGKTLGVRFAENVTHASIPKDKPDGEVILFGSCPVYGTKVVAESRDGSGSTISGAGDLVFCFTWLQLAFAMLGGALVPVAHQSFRAKRGRKGLGRKLLRIDFEGLVGAFAGAIFFLLLFFGAVGLEQLDLNGIPIVLASLPVQNPFAAFLIGLLSGSATGLRALIKEGVLDRVRRAAAPAQAA